MAELMSDEDRALLTRNRPKMVQRLDMTGTFVSELMAREGLNEGQHQIVMSEAGQNNQADNLVGALIRLGTEHTVDKMYYSLSDSGQEHIAKAFLRPPKTKDHSWTATGTPPVAAQPNISVPPNAAHAMAGSPVEIPMTDEHTERLDKYRETIQKSLDPSLTVDKLRSKLVFSKKEGSTILAKTTEEEQVGALLDALQKKNDDAYTTFCTVLRDSKKGFLADLLQ